MLFFQNDDKVFAINIAMLNQICEKKVDIHMTPDVMFNLQYIKICVYEEELTAASFKLNSNKTCILSIVLQLAG